MKCPNDNTTLQMTTRDGIEIDYCPECRGVWLDRGELDKLIERSGSYSQQQAAPAPAPAPQQQYAREHRDYDDDDDDDYRRREHGSYHGGSDHYNNGGHHKKKKEGFLGDLFDF